MSEFTDRLAEYRAMRERAEKAEKARDEAFALAEKALESTARMGVIATSSWPPPPGARLRDDSVELASLKMALDRACKDVGGRYEGELYVDVIRRLACDRDAARAEISSLSLNLAAEEKECSQLRAGLVQTADLLCCAANTACVYGACVSLIKERNEARNVDVEDFLQVRRQRDEAERESVEAVKARDAAVAELARVRSHIDALFKVQS